MRTPRSRAVALSLLLVAILLCSGLAASVAPKGGAANFRADFTASFVIFANGTVSAPGVFSVHGNTYTMTADYVGGIEDDRNGSVLVGDGFEVDHNTGSAGVLVLQSANVTITDFDVIGEGPAVYVAQSLYTSVSHSNLSVAGNSIFVFDSTGVTVNDVDAAGTGGFLVESSSEVAVTRSNFTASAADGGDVLFATSVTLTDDDFSHALDVGLTATQCEELTAVDDRFNAAGSGTGIDLSDVQSANVSSDNLTESGGAGEPIVVQISSNVSLWSDFDYGAANITYLIFQSDQVTIGNASGPGAAVDAIELADDVGVTLIGADFNQAGVGVFDAESTDVSIVDSEFESGGTSVYAYGATGLSISGSNLSQGNNGLLAVRASQISVENSDLNRSNFPVDLTDGTTEVTISGSELDRAQLEAVELSNVSDVAFVDDSLEGSATTAIDANFVQGLNVTGDDFAGSSTEPGPGAVREVNVNASTFDDDSFAWTQSPFSANNSNGIWISDSNFSNASNGPAIALDQDQQILVSDSSFFDDLAEGVDGQYVSELTLAGSDLDDVHGDGLAVDQGTAVDAQSNSFDDEGETGIFLEFGYGFDASENSFDQDANALFLNEGTNWTIVGNTANADSDGGLTATEVTGLVLEGNEFSNESGDTAFDLDAINGFSIGANLLPQDSVALAVTGPSFGTVVGNGFLDDSISMAIDGTVTLLTYHNDFEADGGWQLTDTPPTLAWDDGYPVGGNYWSNYTGEDLFHGPGQNLSGPDGIGDTPFVLDPNDIDRYPLMTPWVDHVATFLETGLPSGATWSVVFNGTVYRSSSGSLTVAPTVGTLSPYEYSVPNVGSYAATPSSGTGELGVGLLVIRLAFAVPRYEVWFIPSGLPPGTPWSLDVNGIMFFLPSEGDGAYLPNGTYNYSVGPVPGYLPVPASGQVTVAGQEQNIAVTFVPFTSKVTVFESGLPAGTSWGMTLTSGTNTTTSAASLSFNLTNGTYSFTVNSVAGYTVTPANGSWMVNGSAVDVYVHFTANSAPSGGPNEIAGSSLLFYELLGVLLIVAVAGWVLFALRRRKNVEALPAPEAPPPPGAT